MLCGRLAAAPVVRVEAEQRAHGDPHRQVAGPLVDVDRLPGAPARERCARLLEHHIDRGDDVLAVKRRHHDPSRAVVVGAVDRQEPVAEERDQVAEARLAPVELLGVLDGDVSVRLGARA